MKQLRDSAEKYTFQAEVNRMMKLIINSLYRNKEVSTEITFPSSPLPPPLPHLHLLFYKQSHDLHVCSIAYDNHMTFLPRVHRSSFVS